MSIEIFLFPKTATKSGLITLLKEEGFIKSKHFIESLNDKNHLHFHWYDISDFNSKEGVEAMVYRTDLEIKQKYKCSEWALHTRTRAGANRQDLTKQNDIIKKARKQFKGNFYNDYGGFNKYIDLSEEPELSPQERGIFLIYSNIKDKLKKCEDSIRNYEHPTTKLFETLPDSDLKQLVVATDPSIVLFNSLIPFAVALIEHFFLETFEILVKYDKNAQTTIQNENIKIKIKDVYSILNTESTLESLISNQYSFQNIEHIHDAYKKYLKLDVLKALSHKRKMGNKVQRISEGLKEIIQRRHYLIHQFAFDYTFKKEEFIQTLRVTEKVIDVIVSYLDNEYNWKIAEYSEDRIF